MSITPQLAQQVLEALNAFANIDLRTQGVHHRFADDVLRARAASAALRAALAATPAQPTEVERDDERDEDEYVIHRMGRLLAEIAIAIKGPEPARRRWGYQDLPQLVRDLVKDVDRMDALESSKANHQWIVARGKDSFTVALKSPYGNCVTRKTLREAIDAALSTEGGGNADQA